MIITMHGLSTMHCNVATEIRIAGETGYDGVELLHSKLLRYLDAGYEAEELNPLFKKHGVRPVVINAQQGVDRSGAQTRKELMQEAERLCRAAHDIGCPTIQLVPLSSLADRPYPEIRKLTAKNIAEIADMGKGYGVRFQLEPIAFSPIHSLAQSLELIDEVARDNVAMVIDFWHLYCGGCTIPDDVARLDCSQIYGVHFCDGRSRREFEEWDEIKFRGYFPGEGEIAVKDWVEAVKSTGFDGVWSSELVSKRHWEWDLWECATRCKEVMEQYIL